MGWVVGIASGTVLCAEESLELPIAVYLPSVFYSLGKVRVADIQPTEADHICPAIPDSLYALFGGEWVIRNDQSRKKGTESFANILNLLDRLDVILAFDEVDFSRLSDLSETDVPFAELFEEERICFDWVFVELVSQSGNRRYLYAQLPGLKILEGNVEQF